MKDEERRTKEMGVRVVLFDDRHPHTDAGYTLLSGQLKDVVQQMDREEALQRSALMDRHTASLDKERIERDMRSGPIAHVVRVGELARTDQPTLASQLQYRPSGSSYDAHLVAARNLLAEAQANQDVLAKYGLSDTVLQVYQEQLALFEGAVKLGDEGRATHKGATPNLGALAKEARQIVRTMDAHNHIRFKNDPKLLGEWTSARSVLGRPGGPGAEPEPGSSSSPGGDVRPAA